MTNPLGAGADPDTEVPGVSSQSLPGQVGIVTGAGRGIGKVIALALAAAGADVVVAGRDRTTLEVTAEAVRVLGRNALVVPVDVRDADGVLELADEVRQTFGRIDVLVCNSGMAGPSAPVWEVDPEAWRDTIAVNLTGAFLCCRAVLPAMITRRSGTIILIGSITGKRPLLHRAPYAASKIALVGLCRTLALEAGPLGIRVNVVSPGFVEGERLDWVIEKQAEALGDTAAHVRSVIEETSALRRFVSASDVAHAVVMLASEAGRSITGIDLNVAAGVVMY